MAEQVAVAAAGPGGPGGPWCGVLGPLEVRGPGGVVRLGGPHQQAVLGLLALQPNAVVHRASIVDALWGPEPPATAMTMIHCYVSRLRRLLPKGPGQESALVTAVSGYQLRAGEADLDLLVFSRLCQQASLARQAGDLPAAFGLLERALGLWRGAPLAGLDLLRDHPAVTALRTSRAAAVVSYAEAARSRAEQDRALPHLRELTRTEPLNERAHACLMAVLAATGQQAAALEIFTQIRQHLDDQLGVQPGAELAAAHLRVLRGQPQPAPDLLADPDPLTTAGDLPAARPPCAPCQLPAVVPDFTGRAAEISQLTTILTTGAGTGVPVAVICGLPGIGKSTLALRAAHQLRPQFPDGQLWIQLDGASARPRSPADVLGELLRTLGVPGEAIPDSLAGKAALYRSRLADRKVLVLADDAASAAQVRQLIPGTAGAAVIVTSRHQLADLPAACIQPLSPLSSQDAVRLLTAIAGQHRVSAEPHAARQLIAACGRLPLAVRIAGARLAGRPSWPVSVISQALADQHRRLDELAAGSLSVRASLAMSYQALDTRSQRALCLLSMLGPVDIASWVIAALLGEPADDVTASLADSSLLTPAGTDATGTPRYRLHDLLRDYAAERLTTEHATEQPAARHRLTQAWLQLTTLADTHLPREPYFPPPADTGPEPDQLTATLASQLTADPIAWFTAERRNLISVIEHACRHGNHQLATKLATRIASYQHIQSRPDDAGHIWQAIVEAASQAGDSDSAGSARLRLAVSLCNRGRHAEAAPAIESCLAAFSRHGDQRALAAARYWLSVCQFNLGDFGQARGTAMATLDLGRQLGDRQTQFLALRIAAATQASMAEHHAEATACADQALTIVRQLEQPAWELEVLHTAAHVCNMTGRPATAISMSAEARELRQRLGVAFNEADWLGIMGDAYRGLGRHQEAVAAYARALPVFRDLLMGRHQALCLLKLGYAYQAAGHYALAVARIEESLPIFRELRLAHYERQALTAIESCRRQERHALALSAGCGGVTARS